MFKVKYVDYIMMLVRPDLNLIFSLFQHKCEVSETVSTTTLVDLYLRRVTKLRKSAVNNHYLMLICSQTEDFLEKTNIQNMA